MTAPESSSQQQVSSMLNALLDRDSAAWGVQMDALDPQIALRALLAASSAAVFRLWPDDPTDAQIAEYAVDVPVEGAPVPAAVIEGLMLAAFGQGSMIEGFSARELTAGSVHLIHAVQGDGRLPNDERDDFVKEIAAAVV